MPTLCDPSAPATPSHHFQFAYLFIFVIMLLLLLLCLLVLHIQCCNKMATNNNNNTNNNNCHNYRYTCWLYKSPLRIVVVAAFVILHLIHILRCWRRKLYLLENCVYTYTTCCFYYAFPSTSKWIMSTASQSESNSMPSSANSWP